MRSFVELFLFCCRFICLVGRNRFKSPRFGCCVHNRRASNACPLSRSRNAATAHSCTLSRTHVSPVLHSSLQYDRGVLTENASVRLASCLTGRRRQHVQSEADNDDDDDNDDADHTETKQNRLLQVASTLFNNSNNEVTASYDHKSLVAVNLINNSFEVTVSKQPHGLSIPQSATTVQPQQPQSK